MLIQRIVPFVLMLTLSGMNTQSAAVQFGTECPLALQIAGQCPSHNNTGSQVIVDGIQTKPGRPGSQGSPGDDRSSAGPRERPGPREVRRCEVTPRYIRLCPVDPETPPEEIIPAAPAITVTDLAQFAPDSAVPMAEPDNVGVAGMPANFVATASTHTRTGTLLGFSVNVRFTPSAFVFHYGDGASATTSTGGQTWAALGQAQFTPTATSHTYQERGTFYADVDVQYSAEIDFGTGWFPVDGVVTADGPPQEIRIFEAHTALVAHTCQQRPDAPGC